MVEVPGQQIELITLSVRFDAPRQIASSNGAGGTTDGLDARQPLPPKSETEHHGQDARQCQHDAGRSEYIIAQILRSAGFLRDNKTRAPRKRAAAGQKTQAFRMAGFLGIEDEPEDTMRASIRRQGSGPFGQIARENVAARILEQIVTRPVCIRERIDAACERSGA